MCVTLPTSFRLTLGSHRAHVKGCRLTLRAGTSGRYGGQWVSFATAAPAGQGGHMVQAGPPRRVTIVDVARHAQVSTTAVSKVLRNAYGSSPTMRAKVHQAIADLGYRPSASARGLRGQTYTLGVMVPDI